MIQLKDVCKYYQVGDDRVRALDHANLHIYPKEFVSIIGPSGSGKSTLMNIIGCLDVADAGEYLLDGLPIESYTENQLAKVRNEKIGFVFQQYNLIPKLTAEENVELPLIYQKVPKKERTERVKEALERVNMYARAKHLPTELSGGQQQRVSIARAIVTRPKLILADEPTGALDSHSTDELLNLLDQVNAQGQTILMVTHSVKAASHARRVLFIKDGKLFHQLYRGEADRAAFYQRIADTLTLIATGGEQNV